MGHEIECRTVATSAQQIKDRADFKRWFVDQSTKICTFYALTHNKIKQEKFDEKFQN